MLVSRLITRTSGATSSSTCTASPHGQEKSTGRGIGALTSSASSTYLRASRTYGSHSRGSPGCARIWSTPRPVITSPHRNTVIRPSGTSLPYVSTGGGTSEGFAGAARSSVAGAPSPVAACRRRCDTTSRMSREPALVEPDGGAAGQRGVVDVAVDVVGVGVGRQPRRWRQPAPAGDQPVQECAGRPVQVLTEHHELSPCRPGRRTIAGPAKGSRGRGLADG